MTFHKSALGNFGSSLPCDCDGYVHTTIKGWMDSPRDGLDDSTTAERREWAREQAACARAELKIANAALADWLQSS